MLIVLIVVSLLTNLAPLLIPLGILLGLVTTMILFGRYAQSAQYSSIEGQPGAARPRSSQSMRGNWSITPAVAGNRNMDIVHRVVGPPGVVLVGEGAPNGLSSLISAEKKKISRIAYGVPITDLQVGESNDQVPIKKLQRKLRMLPRELKPHAISELNSRLKTLPSTLQAPRGPMPQRGGRMPKPPPPEGALRLRSAGRRCSTRDRAGRAGPGSSAASAPRSAAAGSAGIPRAIRPSSRRAWRP